MRGCSEAKARSNPFDEGRLLPEPWGDLRRLASDRPGRCVRDRARQSRASSWRTASPAPATPGCFPSRRLSLRPGWTCCSSTTAGSGTRAESLASSPRPPRHREDYKAAAEFARGLDGVDPDRIILWGTSWSGGHVVYVAAEDPRSPRSSPRRRTWTAPGPCGEMARYARFGQDFGSPCAGSRT